MEKIHAWLLTEGAHGMISQVEGLAKALGASYQHKKIIYNSFWNFFPPKITPSIKNVFNFNEIINDKNNIQVPNILISCGRKSVIPSIVLKSVLKNNHQIYNIHIQDPKISSNKFDYIIVPEHDSLDGRNVITSKGAIHYISAEEIEDARNHLYLKNILTIILGGPNKYYSFLEDELKHIFNQIDELFLNNVDEVKIISSRRTPLNIIQFIKLKYQNNSKVVIDDSLSRQNYITALAQAKKIIVTSDSISMISEAATTGTPIFLARLKPIKNDYRFNKFIELFKKLNITKDLESKDQHWTYDKLYETKRIAEIIKNKIK